MGLERRGGRLVYYRKVRVGGKVRSVDGGGGRAGRQARHRGTGRADRPEGPGAGRAGRPRRRGKADRGLPRGRDRGRGGRPRIGRLPPARPGPMEETTGPGSGENAVSDEFTFETTPPRGAAEDALLPVFRKAATGDRRAIKEAQRRASPSTLARMGGGDLAEMIRQRLA